MASANKFLGTGTMSVTDGSLNIFGSRIGAKDLLDATKDNVKIDGSGRLFATDLAIDDVSGLQAALDSAISNPLTSNLDANDFKIENAQTVEVSNGTYSATLDYSTGTANYGVDLQDVIDTMDVTQNMLLSTTAGQTDLTGDLTTTGDFQFGGALVGNLVINDVNISPTQTTALGTSEQNANFAGAMLALNSGSIDVDIASGGYDGTIRDVIIPLQTNNLQVVEQNANFGGAMLALNSGSIDVDIASGGFDGVMRDVIIPLQTNNLQVVEQNANFGGAMLALNSGSIDVDINSGGYDGVITNISMTSQTTTVKTTEEQLKASGDSVDSASKGPLMFAWEVEAKSADHAEPLIIQDGNLQTYNNNPNMELGEPVRNWYNISSDRFTPFTGKFADLQGASTADINGFYTSTTPTNDFNFVNVVDKIKLTPFQAIEVTIAGNFLFDTTTADAEDFQCFGLFSDIPTNIGLLPNSAIWFKGSASYLPSLPWFGQIITDGSLKSQNPLTINHSPGDDSYFPFRFRVFNNGAVVLVWFYDYTEDTGLFSVDAHVKIAFPLEDSEFYIGNFYGASAGKTTTTEIVSYQIRRDSPNLTPYPSLTQYESFAHPAFTALQSGAVRALTAVRLNPANTTQGSVFIREVDTMATSAANWVLGVYVNPTLSGALTWNNYGRIQYSTQQNAVTITAGTPSFIEFGLRWSGGGTGRNHYKVPTGSLKLQETTDVIVLGVYTYANDSFVSGITFFY